MSYLVKQDGGVMKSITELLKNLRKESVVTYRQMELPLAGARLSRDQARVVMELRKIRQRLATM